MIEVEGISDIKDEVKAYLDSLKDIKSLYKEIEDQLNVIVQESVGSQQSATTNRAYKNLTQATQKLQGKAASPALYSRTLGGIPAVKMVVEGGKSDRAYVYSNLPYAGVHQFGNPNNKLFGHNAPIPARPFLPIKKNGDFTEKFLQELDLIMQSWIDKKINEGV